MNKQTKYANLWCQKEESQICLLYYAFSTFSLGIFVKLIHSTILILEVDFLLGKYHHLISSCTLYDMLLRYQLYRVSKRNVNILQHSTSLSLHRHFLTLKRYTFRIGQDMEIIPFNLSLGFLLFKTALKIGLHVIITLNKGFCTIIKMYAL